MAANMNFNETEAGEMSDDEDVIVVDDEELNPDEFQSFIEARKRSTDTLGRRWRHIIEKYSDPNLKSDIIDLNTLGVVVDQGHLASAQERPYGRGELKEAAAVSDEKKYWQEVLHDDEQDGEDQDQDVSHSNAFNKTYIVNGNVYSQSDVNCYKTFQGVLLSGNNCVLEEEEGVSDCLFSDSATSATSEGEEGEEFWEEEGNFETEETWNKRDEPYGYTGRVTQKQDENNGCYIISSKSNRSPPSFTLPLPNRVVPCIDRQSPRGMGAPTKLSSLGSKNESKNSPLFKHGSEREHTTYKERSPVPVPRQNPLGRGNMKVASGISTGYQALDKLSSKEKGAHQVAPMKFNNQQTKTERPVRRIQTTMLASDEVVKNKQFAVHEWELPQKTAPIMIKSVPKEPEKSTQQCDLEASEESESSEEGNDISSASDFSEIEEVESTESGVYEIVDSPLKEEERLDFGSQQGKLSGKEILLGRFIQSCGQSKGENFAHVKRRDFQREKRNEFDNEERSDSEEEKENTLHDEKGTPNYTKKNRQFMQAPSRNSPVPKEIHHSPTTKVSLLKLSDPGSPMDINDREMSAKYPTNRNYRSAEKYTERTYTPTRQSGMKGNSQSPRRLSNYASPHRPTATKFGSLEKSEGPRIPMNYFDRPLSVRNELLSPLARVLQSRKRKEESAEKETKVLNPAVAHLPSDGVRKNENSPVDWKINKGNRVEKGITPPKRPCKPAEFPAKDLEMKFKSPEANPRQMSSSTPTKPGMALKMELDISCIPNPSRVVPSPLKIPSVSIPAREKPKETQPVPVARVEPQVLTEKGKGVCKLTLKKQLGSFADTTYVVKENVDTRGIYASLANIKTEPKERNHWTHERSRNIEVISTRQMSSTEKVVDVNCLSKRKTDSTQRLKEWHKEPKTNIYAWQSEVKVNRGMEKEQKNEGWGKEGRSQEQTAMHLTPRQERKENERACFSVSSKMTSSGPQFEGKPRTSLTPKPKVISQNETQAVKLASIRKLLLAKSQKATTTPKRGATRDKGVKDMLKGENVREIQSKLNSTAEKRASCERTAIHLVEKVPSMKTAAGTNQRKDEATGSTGKMKGIGRVDETVRVQKSERRKSSKCQLWAFDPKATSKEPQEEMQANDLDGIKYLNESYEDSRDGLGREAMKSDHRNIAKTEETSSDEETLHSSFRNRSRIIESSSSSDSEVEESSEEELEEESESEESDELCSSQTSSERSDEDCSALMTYKREENSGDSYRGEESLMREKQEEDMSRDSAYVSGSTLNMDTSKQSQGKSPRNRAWSLNPPTLKPLREVTVSRSADNRKSGQSPRTYQHLENPQKRRDTQMERGGHSASKKSSGTLFTPKVKSDRFGEGLVGYSEPRSPHSPYNMSHGSRGSQTGRTESNDVAQGGNDRYGRSERRTVYTPKSKMIRDIKNDSAYTASPCLGPGFCKKAFCFKCCGV